MVSVISALASAFGPPLIGALLGHQGDFSVPFGAMVLVGVVALIASLFVGPIVARTRDTSDLPWLRAGDGNAYLAQALASLLARTEGNLSLIVVDVDERKRDLAERLGASSSAFFKADELTGSAIRNLTEGRGVDLAIEVSGSPAAVQQALSAVRVGGTLLQVGIPAGSVSLPLGQVVPREVSIVTTNGMVCEVDLTLALALLSQTDLAALLTDRIIPLDALVSDGLEPLALHEVLWKVLVHIQEA